jgi:lipopolysaccharide/colanic/teichoic acid biosynthesis glycosyltransferase
VIALLIIASPGESILAWSLIAAGAGAAAALVVEPFLRRLGAARPPGSYRWAAVVGAGAACALMLLVASGEPAWTAAAASLGAFSAAAAASWRKLGLVEDNYPPTPFAQQAVLQAHAGRLPARLPLSSAKRLFDLLLSATGLLAAAPLGLVLAAWIWIEEPGPVFFVKNSVGLRGKTFRQWKLRTMVHGAEARSGPILASEDDARALRSGRFLRKTALDELPQLLNILLGDMSFVGPRPQRTVLVQEYLLAMPEYAERHQVRPGLAGLAQVAGDYYLTPRQKLRLDRLYVQHASVLFDSWLVVLAFLVVFWWRWQPGWRGQLTPDQIRGRRRARPSRR